MNQLSEVDADSSTSITAEPEDKVRQQLRLKIYENNRVQLQDRGKGGEIYIRRGYNVKNMKKDSRNRYTLRPGKNTKTLLKFFSMLTSTFRLQRITNESFYIMLRLHENVFQLLLKTSIDIFKKDNFEITAFDYAFLSSMVFVKTNANKC